MNLARLGNRYLADTEPWKLAKTDMGRVGTIPNSGVQIAAALAIVSEPFLPFTAAKLHDLLKLSSESWEDAGRSDLLPEGHQLNERSEEHTSELQSLMHQ